MYEIHVYKYTQRLKIEKPTPYTPKTSCQSSLFQTSEVILSDAVSRGHFNMTKNKLLSAMTLNVDMNHFDYFVKIDHSIVVSRPWHIKVTKLHVLKGVGSF